MGAHLEFVLCAPEMAVLVALAATLRASAAALTAAHAELEAEDFAASPHPPSAQACLAAALLTQVEALLCIPCTATAPSSSCVRSGRVSRLPPSTPPAEPHPDQPSLDVRAHCSRPARAPSTTVTRARASSLMPISLPVQISINKRAR
ncbi:hypothetical protein JQX13_11515 [Archangium violaceum]|uniref:hypothetical protein n=1 Tax=Archangium violaceum TaxID=83451 RepID=UPI00193C47D5|nr:hypothetical protein [Archangium violaceum]QRK10645.1 hypothetical protein JQX13_11515 [Archangium violaceum]